MKTFYTLTAFAATMAYADDAALDAALADINENEVDEKKFSAIVDMAFHKLDGHPSFNVDVVNANRNTRKNFSYMLQDYGCHCFPNHKSISGGRGKPKDALDEACRALYRCHKCVDIESPGVCEADGGYKYQLKSAGDIGCTASDKFPDCKTQQCQCDREFADSVFDLWTGNDWTYDSNLWLNPRYVKAAEDMGVQVFDFDAECQMGFNQTPDACCGDAFPNKVPYNSNDFGCCSAVSKPFNANLNVCCDADGVKNIADGCF